MCTEGDAVFTCVVDRDGTGITNDEVMWQLIRMDNGQVSSITGMGSNFFSVTTTLSGDILTSTLTITGATDSNVVGTNLYRCVVPVSDVMSRNATINIVTGTNLIVITMLYDQKCFYLFACIEIQYCEHAIVVYVYSIRIW